MEDFSIDGFDRKILALLQRDATLSLAEIAERVGLSSTPCWRRIQKLEQAGVIRRRVALLEPQALGLACASLLCAKPIARCRVPDAQQACMRGALPADRKALRNSRPFAVCRGGHFQRTTRADPGHESPA